MAFEGTDCGPPGMCGVPAQSASLIALYEFWVLIDTLVFFKIRFRSAS
jgi:hypothetical protein